MDHIYTFLLKHIWVRTHRQITVSQCCPVMIVSQILTYLCPSTRWEHGPSIKALHRILRCAMVAISCQVYPIFLASDSTSRRQVFLGRPLFLFPWGFHVSACLVMLVVAFSTCDQSNAIFFVLFLFLLAVDLSWSTKCCC